MTNAEYTLINRKTGKQFRKKFATRDTARMAKRDMGFKHNIVRADSGMVIR